MSDSESDSNWDRESLPERSSSASKDEEYERKDRFEAWESLENRRGIVGLCGCGWRKGVGGSSGLRGAIFRLSSAK